MSTADNEMHESVSGIIIGSNRYNMRNLVANNSKYVLHELSERKFHGGLEVSRMQQNKLVEVGASDPMQH